MWTASAPTLTPGKPVTLSWTNPTGQRFELIVSVDEGYLFTVRQRVANLGAAPVAVTPYGLVSRAAKSADASSWTSHVGPISFLGAKADYDIDWETLDEDRAGVTRDSRGGWLGFTDKYWLTALAPANGAPIAASFRKSASGAYQADYAGAPDDRRPRPGGQRRRPACSPAPRKRLARPLRSGRHHQADQVDRLGLVRMVHAADLLAAEVAVPGHRQLRRGDHLPDLHRPPADVPDRRQAVPLDGRDAHASSPR